MYTENVDVNVANLTIKSENGSTSCIVQAASTSDHVFEVTVDYVNITGFTAKGETSYKKAGIYLDGVEHCDISNNTASNNSYGIYLRSSSNNTLTNNTVSNNRYVGIELYSSSNNNTLTNNSASNNTNYDFYSDKYSHDNMIEDLTIASYPTTISFTYGQGIGLKGVTTPEQDPDGKVNIGKYVNVTNETEDS
jgi:parallel beta-helix repeat protein